MLVRVVYVSSVAAGMTSDGMERLVASAQRRNRQLDLTGALLNGDGRFVQALEGREEAVDSMMAKIEADQRHTGIHILARQNITKRAFGAWDMAFVHDAEWLQNVQAVVDGTMTVDALVSILVDKVEARRSAPY